MSPVNFIIFWLLLWCTFSNFSFGGLRAISFETNAIVIVGVVSMYIGSLANLSKLSIGSAIDIEGINNYLKPKFKILSILLILLLSILVIKFINLILIQGFNFQRVLLYGTKDEPSILFGDQKFALLYWIFGIALLRVIVVLGFTLSYINRDLKYIVIANLLNLIDSIVMLGRAAFVDFFVQILFYFIVTSDFNKFNSKKINLSRLLRLSILPLAAIFILASSLSLLRGDYEEFNFKRIIKEQIANYHTVGFVIFDDELRNENSRLNTVTTYGLSSLGVLERLLVLGIRRVDDSIDSASGQNAEYLAIPRELGFNEDQNPYFYNAFGTVFYTFFIDGGYMFIVGGFFIFGWFFSRVRIIFIGGRFYYVGLLYLLFYSGIHMVFGSPIESTNWWLSFIAIYYLTKKCDKLTPKLLIKKL